MPNLNNKPNLSKSKIIKKKFNRNLINQDRINYRVFKNKIWILDLITLMIFKFKYFVKSVRNTIKTPMNCQKEKTINL